MSKQFSASIVIAIAIVSCTANLLRAEEGSNAPSERTAELSRQIASLKQRLDGQIAQREKKSNDGIELAARAKAAAAEAKRHNSSVCTVLDRAIAVEVKTNEQLAALRELQPQFAELMTGADELKTQLSNFSITFEDIETANKKGAEFLDKATTALEEHNGKGKKDEKK